MPKQSKPLIQEGIFQLFQSGRAVMFMWKNEPGWPVEYVSDSCMNLLGYNPEVFYSGEVTYSEVVHPEDIKRVSSEVMQFSENPSAKTFVHEDYRIKNANGEYIWVYDTTYIHRDETGAPTHFIGYIFDVTEHHRTKDRLEEQQAAAMETEKYVALAQMSAGVAHEINNPITIALGFLKNLERDIQQKEDKESLKKIRKIYGAISRVTKIVKSLLTFSHDDKNIDEAPTVVSDITDMIEDFLAEKLRSRGVHFEVENSIPMAKIKVNNLQVGQVFLNLVNNACDAVESLPDRWIKILVQKQGPHHLSITVQDSGEGISDDVLEKIFNPFFSTKPVGKGTGLGLSLSKAIIERNNGQIHYQLLDGHTAFAMVFPLDKSQVMEEAG